MPLLCDQTPTLSRATEVEPFPQTCGRGELKSFFDLPVVRHETQGPIRLQLWVSFSYDIV